MIVALPGLFSYLFCTFPHDAFIKISGMVFKIQSGHEYIVEMAIFNNYCVQRAASPKAG